MVKADTKRDYFADLELPYGASPDEVKKQFRKLAKLYHPDRNPGKEVDFIPKFQAIQAANEILTDAPQRLKYEQDRKRAGYGTTTQKASTTTRQNTTFPPPPRRAATQAQEAKAQGSAGTYKAPPSAGAQRYNGWAKAANNPDWQNSKDDPHTRAGAYRGFADMKNNTARNFPFPPPPPRSRYPPTAQRPASSYVPQASSDPKPSKSWDPFPKGNPGFPGMSRTQSTRRKPGFDPSTPGADEQRAGTSAYASVHRNQPQAEPSYFDSRPTPTSPKSPTTKANPLRHTRSHEDSPEQRAGYDRQSAKYATSGGEKLNLFGTGLGRSASVRNSPVDPKYDDYPPPRRYSHHDPGNHHSASPTSRKPTAAATYSSESSSSESSTDEEIDVSTRPKANPRQRFNKNIPRQRGPGLHDTSNHFANTNQDTLHSPQKDNTATYEYPPPPPRNKPFYPDLNSQPQGANPPEGLSKDKPSNSSGSFAKREFLNAFSASDWDGQFDPEAFAPPSETDRRSPSKTARKAGTQTRSRTASPGKPQDTANATGEPTMPAFQPAKFDADKWAEQLKDQVWATPTPDLGRVKGQKRGSRAGSTVKKPTNGKPTTSIAGENANKTIPSSTAEAVPPETTKAPSATVTDAMDIDPPTGSDTKQEEPIKNDDTSTKPVPVESSIPSVNLDDLQNVHPFKPTTSGLGSLDDLSTTLPFESRPAASVDLDAPKAFVSVKDLKLPKPPKVPSAPMEESLSPGRWVSYVNAMNAYMKEWSIFNKQILEHFDIRQARMDHNMANNWIGAIGDGPTDIDALEKGSGAQAGYKTYMNWIEQDAAVREWWDVACEKHRAAVVILGTVREKMKAMNSRSSVPA